MIPWEKIDKAIVPGQNEKITLLKRGNEFSIRTRETELMNSRVHGSEDALAELTLSRMNQKENIKILIGGLGMGYTLAAALEQSGPDACIVVSELVPDVVKWNRKYLGHLSGMPLLDSRVSVEEKDVANIIRRYSSVWNAILLDVDNGPAGLTCKSNNQLYGRSGLKAAFSALCPGGILSVWSAAEDGTFTQRLTQCGFKTRTVTVRARKSGKGGRHTIWMAEKPDSKPI